MERSPRRRDAARSGRRESSRESVWSAEGIVGGKMIVLKLGGGQGINFDSVAQDLAGIMAEEQTQFIVVHGGSAETALLGSQLNHPPRFLQSVEGGIGRYHDSKTLDIYLMATAGKVNKRLVGHMQRAGVNAVGVSGADGRLFQGKRLEKVRFIDDRGETRELPRDFTGRLDKVNVDLLELLLDRGYTPVITPLALSEENELVYIDADRAAANIAAQMGADTYIVLATVPGLLKDPDDSSTLIRSIPLERYDTFVEEFARGRMKRKMAATLEALRGDVRHVVIADGRVDHPIRRALSGHGTVIRAEPPAI
jgi:acetylglutamate/LysW-gamma-L-alpha-aminoadipate kinase